MKSIFLKSWHKLVASQLRSPSGILAGMTGKKMNKSNEELYELTLKNLDIHDGNSILEIGFGNGKFFSSINKRAQNLKITGIDHSPEMISASLKLNSELHETGVLNTLVGSSDKLLFPDKHFDRIFCINVIYFWDNPEDHLLEIYRVLKPGGYFCIGLRPKDNLEKFPLSEHGFRLYTEEELKALVEAKHFRFLRSELRKEGSPNPKKHKPSFESLCVVCTKGAF